MKCFNELIEAFADIIKDIPDAKNDTVIENTLKTTINSITHKEYPISCNNVFISRNRHGGDEYIVAVIPCVPKYDIMTYDRPSDYDIDIDVQSFISPSNPDGYTNREVAIWFLHELVENIITSSTLTRYKKSLIKYYDTQNKSLMEALMSPVGALSWIMSFSHTDLQNVLYKYYTSSGYDILNMIYTDDEFNNLISKIYNNNHHRYNGEQADRIGFMQFNKLARAYCTFVLKYNNTDYSTFSKYICAHTGSELVKYYAGKEPQQLAMFSEKNAYNIFDDNKLIYEDAEGSEDDNLYKYINIYNELVIEARNLTMESDRIRFTAKLRDLLSDLASSTVSERYKFDEAYHNLRAKVEDLAEKLKASQEAEMISILMPEEELDNIGKENTSNEVEPVNTSNG